MMRSLSSFAFSGSLNAQSVAPISAVSNLIGPETPQGSVTCALNCSFVRPKGLPWTVQVLMVTGLPAALRKVTLPTGSGMKYSTRR
eukprot:scaffold49299_cov21-Cyclotella_meneghiniana.AAC.1